MKPYIAIINGPNLNLLGRREPQIYGGESMDTLLQAIKDEFPEIRLDYYQSNHEGRLIDILQELGYGDERPLGIVLNAGGYTHTSVALADAISAIPVPVIEVHISNVAARESFRHHSYLSPVCAGTIQGLGPAAYSLAVRALLKKSGHCK